jgi:hypothetical protein
MKTIRPHRAAEEQDSAALRMKRFLPHLCWLSGLLVLFIGFAVGGGVPYPHPTPELRALEDKQMRLFDRFAIIGIVLFASGVIWIIMRLLIRFFRKTHS